MKKTKTNPKVSYMNKHCTLHNPQQSDAHNFSIKDNNIETITFKLLYSNIEIVFLKCE